ncbi:MAG: hypothetical protein KIT83_06265 [Bryobacterales bacterium]|nr:hypothetical protein [Bryobacterales bacterium]
MRLSVLLLIAIRLIGPMVFCSGADALTVSWGDLANVVAKRPVVVEVERQRVLRGELLSQDADGVLVAVHSSKPGGLYAKYANVRVDRNSITRFRVVKDPQRVSGRWAGTIVGYFAGGLLAVAAGGGEQDPRLLIGWIGGMITGYHVGKSLDKELLELQILDQKIPASQQEASPGSSAVTRLPNYLLREVDDADTVAAEPAARWEPRYALRR